MYNIEFTLKLDKSISKYTRAMFLSVILNEKFLTLKSMQ